MSRVFVIGAGFSKAVANAPLANELFELIYKEVLSDKTVQGPGQWQEDFSSLMKLVSYLQNQAKPLIDFLNKKDTPIKTSEIIPDLHPINIEYLCTILDLNINYCYIPKGIGVDLKGCPIPYLGKITVDALKEARRMIQHYIVELLLPHRLSAQKDMLENVMSTIKSDDIIITFNYDVLIEQILWEQKLWNPWDGYLIGNIVKYERVQKDDRPKTTIPVIKLHGSVNWMQNRYGTQNDGEIGIYTTHLHNNEPFFDGLKVEADHRQYESKYPLNSHVVLPTLMKTFQEHWEIKLVQEASKAIAKANEIYILGYSLPDADAMANLIFSNIKKETKIFIVNPGNPLRLANRLIEKYDLNQKNIIYEASTIEEWIANEFKYVEYEKKEAEIQEMMKLFGYVPLE